MAKQLPIVCDSAAIAERLRELERERMQVRFNPLSLPVGYVILLPDDMTIPKEAQVVFILEVTTAVPALHYSLSIEAPSTAITKLINCSKAEFPSMQWVDKKILLSEGDCGRLARRVREARRDSRSAV